MPVKREIDYNGYGFTAAGAFYGITVQDIFVQGILFFMCVHGVSVFLETPKHQREGRLPYILLSIYLVISSLLHCSLNVFRIFYGLYLPASGEEFVMQWDDDPWMWATILAGILWTLYILVADGLLLWRTYIIWTHKRWVLVLPVLTFIAVIPFGALTTREYLVTTETRTMTTTFTLLNVANNILCTGLITYRLVRARMEFSQSIPGRKLGVYSGVVAILIESALPLSLFGLISGVVMVSTPAPTTLEGANRIIKLDTVLRSIYESAAQLAPQMIIFRVTTGRSWMKPPSHSSGEVFSQALGFRHEPAENTFMTTPGQESHRQGQMDMDGSDSQLHEKSAAKSSGLRIDTQV
ncbi:hypothetical protein CC1G_05775 [Coprinopsis cinerea okayama7|uniref:Integral membrane protein n=1 Tax=Coprinopsis cinerea (strain Okayama-7 / 130 / ATCC MYA-4618 / FGSC 9003) TaxID=240176 RepID=A8NLA2_COPC7|nr:hypothetical protein CC1G_05775 [Coprinopsis cinerea okayama7\|eukprot:XP_001834638.1 hypothetical protein CC1G_05775 [Coprinopsis cinerea okayama7\